MDPAVEIAQLRARVAELEEALRRRATPLEAELHQPDLQQPGLVLRQLLDAIPDSLYVKDLRLRKLLSNRTDLAYMGLAAEADALGQSDEAVYSPEEASHFRQQDERVLRGEAIINHEERITFRGEEHWLLTTKVPLLDAAGNVVGLVGVGREITELKRIQDDLERLNRTLEERVQERTASLEQANLMLEQAARLRDEFLANMSHELRTPLTGVLAMSEALQTQTHGVVNEHQLRLLRRIEESGRHLLEVINDILDLSKLEAGKLELNTGSIDAEQIGRACLQIVAGQAAAKRQNLRLELCPSPISLCADPRRLKQMLINLLGNGIKFTPEGGEIGLRIEADEDQGTVSFTVSDNGIGIALEDQPKLFRPFIQLDSSLTRRHPGTGLGLALVKRMAELHGGSVAVASTPGNGSRFTITMPLRPPPGQTTELVSI